MEKYYYNKIEYNVSGVVRVGLEDTLANYVLEYSKNPLVECIFMFKYLREDNDRPEIGLTMVCDTEEHKNEVMNSFPSDVMIGNVGIKLDCELREDVLGYLKKDFRFSKIVYDGSNYTELHKKMRVYGVNFDGQIEIQPSLRELRIRKRTNIRDKNINI
jgi:hypothetical protein